MPIANVAMDEAMTRAALNGDEIFKIARVRQLIKGEHARAGESPRTYRTKAEPMKPAPPVTSNFI